MALRIRSTNSFEFYKENEKKTKEINNVLATSNISPYRSILDDNIIYMLAQEYNFNVAKWFVYYSINYKNSFKLI